MKKILSGFMAFVAAVSLTVTAATSVETYAAGDTLTVNCSKKIRDVTHCANGSLYGVTEKIPSNTNQLVQPLHPNVFTNPARSGSGYQQPTGDAIQTAKRLSGTTGKVMIRLADICPNWPYSFPGMNNWLLKVKAVIEEKLKSGVNNYYGYEIWNEPCYTWNEAKNGSFYTLWQKTYNLIRENDPSAKIVGPSDGYYDHNRMLKFMQYCKKNSCLPDVVCWHELSSNGSGSNIEDFPKNYKDYRAIEKSLGISERAISINEYCDVDHAKEGCPGSAARYIAKFERYSVDSACISWWWTAAPGRLGSLLGTNTQKNAGWYFYKWYGDMSGKMLNVSTANDSTDRIDGFACEDDKNKYISLLFGGTNNGTVNINLNHIPSWIGNSATIKIEAVDWTGKDAVSTGPYTISAKNYAVNNSTININLSGLNSTSGYRLYVTKGVPSSQVRYEAENGEISNANIFNSSNASEGKYVGQIDYNDQTTPVYSYVDFMVCVPSDGQYNLAIRYANGSNAESTQGLAYNSGAWQTITYPQTSGWARFSTKNVTVNLNAGINVIRLAKGSPYYSGGINYAELDYIELTKK